MNLHLLETVVVGLVIIAVVTIRLSRWQSVDTGKLLRMPAILLILGLISLTGSAQQLEHGFHLQVLDVVILGVELGVGLAVGWLIGRLTEIRTFEDGTKARLAGVGLVVFLGFVAVRIGLGVVAATFGASLAAMPAMALFVLAVIKGVQGLMVRERVQRHHEAEQARTYAEMWR